MSGAEPSPRVSAARGTLLGGAVLAAVLAAAAATALAVGAGRPGWADAVAFVTAVTAVGSLGGWMAARLPATDPALAVAAGLGSTALRVLPPLAALAWLAGRGAALREAGAGGLLIGFYLLLLATAIFLHIMLASTGQTRRRAERR